MLKTLKLNTKNLKLNTKNKGRLMSEDYELIDYFETSYDASDAIEHKTPNMVHSIIRSVEIAQHLLDEDQANIDLALIQAEIIDNTIESGDPEKIKGLAYGPITTLHNLLSSLGLNPSGRKALGIDDLGDDDDDW